MFKNETNAEKFFKYLNSKYPSVRFTTAKETNKNLPIFDVLEKVKVGYLLFQCIGRKRILDFLHNIIVLHPFSNKIDLRKWLIHRVFKINSSDIIFHNENNKIKNILQKKHVPCFCYK